MKKILVGILLILGSCALASEGDGPHGGKIVRSEEHEFEVKVQPNSKNLEVYTLSKKNAAPSRIAITLIPLSGPRQTVTLNAINLKDPLPKYQGELSLASGSYIGAELRFELGSKKVRIPRFKP